MPVIKFSRAFYDRLGEAVVNELVESLDRMDAAYRADLKQINELTFARFDARIDQRTAELRAELHVVEARLEKKIDTSVANLQASMERSLREQTRFLYLGWAIQIAATLGLWLR